jgi:hypothetical protein
MKATCRYDDLKKERDAFIQQFFRKGAQLTEELLKENERLRDKVSELEEREGKLVTTSPSDTRSAISSARSRRSSPRSRTCSARTRASQADTSRSTSTTARSRASSRTSRTCTSPRRSSTRRAPCGTCIRNLKELLAQFLGAA